MGSAGMTFMIYFIRNSVMQTYTPTHHILWRSNRGTNETLAAYVHHLKTEAKRYNFNIDIATICIFIKGLFDAYQYHRKGV